MLNFQETKNVCTSSFTLDLEESLCW